MGGWQDNFDCQEEPRPLKNLRQTMRSKLWLSARERTVARWRYPNGDSPQLGMTSLEEGVRAETREGGTLGSLELKARNCGQNTTWVGVLADGLENGPSLVELPSCTRLTGQKRGPNDPFLPGAQLGMPQGAPPCPQESPGLAAGPEVCPSFS